MSSLFGGGNPNSIYVPLTEIEQESIARLVESGDLYVDVVGWGYHYKPMITYGDARVQVQFKMLFDRPALPMDVYYFDLELRTHSGRLIFKDRQSVVYNGCPIQVAAGVCLTLVWDIQVRHIDPQLVKDLVQGAVGLTSRLQDRDTGSFTLTGNMKLSAKQKKILLQLRQQEARWKIIDQKKIRL